MVTSATWIDYDDDGQLDLVVVGEWMPVRVFHQEQRQASSTERMRRACRERTAGGIGRGRRSERRRADGSGARQSRSQLIFARIGEGAGASVCRRLFLDRNR